jgi:hypothetical protein
VGPLPVVGALSLVAVAGAADGEEEEEEEEEEAAATDGATTEAAAEGDDEEEERAEWTKGPMLSPRDGKPTARWILRAKRASKRCGYVCVCV